MLNISNSHNSRNSPNHLFVPLISRSRIPSPGPGSRRCWPFLRQWCWGWSNHRVVLGPGSPVPWRRGVVVSWLLGVGLGVLESWIILRQISCIIMCNLYVYIYMCVCVILYLISWERWIFVVLILCWSADLMLSASVRPRFWALGHGAFTAAHLGCSTGARPVRG